MEKIKILIVDDQQVVRKGIRLMLSEENDFNIIGEAENGQQAIEKVKENLPDIVLMDIKMPKMDGIEATRLITSNFPDVHVIMFTLYDEYLKESIEAGAAGYILKDVKSEELIRAIRSVISGRSHLALSLTRNYLHDIVVPQRDTQIQQTKNIKLSVREAQIINLLSKNLTNKEIAEALNVSENTVKVHLYRISTMT